MISISRPGQLAGGGGVVAEFFPVAAVKDQSNSLNDGTFLDISGRPESPAISGDTHSKNVTT